MKIVGRSENRRKKWWLVTVRLWRCLAKSSRTSLTSHCNNTNVGCLSPFIDFLHDFILFVIDIHQNRSISPFLTPFDHFHRCQLDYINSQCVIYMAEILVFSIAQHFHPAFSVNPFNWLMAPLVFSLFLRRAFNKRGTSRSNAHLPLKSVFLPLKRNLIKVCPLHCVSDHKRRFSSSKILWDFIANIAKIF